MVVSQPGFSKLAACPLRTKSVPNVQKVGVQNPLFFVRSGRPANSYPIESGGFDYSNWGHYWSNQTSLNDIPFSYYLGFDANMFASRNEHRYYGLSLRCLSI